MGTYGSLGPLGARRNEFVVFDSGTIGVPSSGGGSRASDLALFFSQPLLGNEIERAVESGSGGRVLN
eukprot:scaffold347587_cov19-Prasinocladus_malaysianus.AAC.2